jgi:Polysaccharide lyase family 4, domain II
MKATSCVLASLFVSVSSISLAADYQVAAVADGGSIKGKITFKGNVPTKTVLPTKDKEVCGGPRKESLVTVGGGGEVKDAIIVLKGVTKGKDWSKDTNKKPEIVNLKCNFEPHVQVIRSGNIDIVNADDVLHNTHGYYGKNTAFNLALPTKDGRVTKPLKRPGEVRVDCDAHGWMEGWIYVAESPYFAQTAANGTFTITDVPPGDYTMVVWQEYVGETEVKVSVKAKEAVEVPVELKK